MKPLLEESTLAAVVRAVADDLEALLPELRLLAGKKGQINSPATNRLARSIVALRDAAAQEDS